MKKLLIALAAVAITATSYGQAKLVFNNIIPGDWQVPVYIAGTTTGAGSLGDVQAQLLAGETLLGSTTFFPSPNDAFLRNATVEVPGNTGELIDNLRIRFVLGGTTIGESDPFQATPGMAPNPPTNIGGFEGGLSQFSELTVVPEPSTIALALLGVGAFLFRRRK